MEVIWSNKGGEKLCYNGQRRMQDFCLNLVIEGFCWWGFCRCGFCLGFLSVVFYHVGFLSWILLILTRRNFKGWVMGYLPNPDHSTVTY